MPHKHTRKGEVDKSTVDLPPTTIAKPLSVSKSAKENGIFTSELNTTRKNNKKRKHNPDINDDTPKAFQRLMMFQQGKKLPKGLDDGVRTKKAKKNKSADEKDEKEGTMKEEKAAEKDKAVMPTIKPGEKMSEFSARVDAALPVSGLMNKTAKNGKDPLGLKIGRTYKEKKMHKLYDQWREEERKIQDKRMDARDMEEMQSEDENGQVVWKDLDPSTSGKKKKKGKNKKKKLVGEVEDFEGDPWAKLKRDRGEGKVGLNDVVQAPPTFKHTPKEKYKVRGARVEVENVPKASGSLRRREELGEVRKSVVEGYRKMMMENKARFAEGKEE
ncbi:hypothetical protein HYFRA_00003595 [Hymenoscyphus fraxineus]|uniref:Urease accessory protein n=1 Tax=Hymenoscyphus fraxineus TaxID=746836 RepID=A0A9N9KXJ6_9HELO|nr:hypothetical protein HYFRA_00003595 [Hymenoscyphus fraxineus]